MFGKLTLADLPLDQPIIMGAVVFAIICGVLILSAITYYRKWTVLWTEWLTTVDHKKIGVMYILVALVMLFRGFCDAIMMRTQQAIISGGGDSLFPPHHYDQLFSAHGVIMIFFVAMPLVIGLMNIVVPLQIGARDVAFPFLNSLSFWLYFFSVVLIMLSLGIGEFAQTGWLAYVPLSGKAYSPGVGVDYWIWSIQISGIGTLLTAVNFIVTITRMRAPGMTWLKMPIFTWTALCSNVMILSVFPILTATVVMLTLDRYLGFHFFTNDLGGNQMMYVNLIWAWGHPEVYILILPAFGVYSEVVATFCKKRLFGYTSLVCSTLAITCLSLVVWLHHFFTMGAGANVNAFFGIATMVIAIPTGAKVFNWLFTMYRGRVEFSAPMWWTLGFLIVFVLGGMTGVLLSVPGANFVLHNSVFLVAHFHNVIIGGVVFGVMAGVTYWFPKAFGFCLNETLGKLSCTFWITGFFCAFMPLYILGMMGMTRRLGQSALAEWHPLLMVALFGAVLILCGILTLAVQVVASIRHRHHSLDLTGDPWDARTLEWSTASPPPAYNFAHIPQDVERDAFWDMKQRGIAYRRPASYSDIYLPKNTCAGLLIGGFSLLLGFGMVWQIWWMAGFGLLGMLATYLVRAFNGNTEYCIPAAEVEKIEAQRYAQLAAHGRPQPQPVTVGALNG